jgi:formylglycine-generating enzyme required for sulfatase activity
MNKSAPQTSGFRLPMLEWCEIPASLEGLPAFWISKYPVTNAQFQEFISAPDGYQNKVWWEQMAKPGHALKSPEWSDDTCPRETVNWYQALAFCRWLSHQTGLSISLPAEGQWQRAAQGNRVTQFPWGELFDKTRCNTKESHIGRTTPVDRYLKGASPFGVVDLSGNVWEWCLNASEDPADVDPASDAPRALRGGAWCYRLEIARIASRHRNYPDAQASSYGFRVVAAIPV